jgi:thioesterase domain-containing protein/acyl carrier protein
VPEAAELRRVLSDKLPDYMVPSAYVSLQHLPVTPNGKLDRRALEQMGVSARTEPAAAYRQPRDRFEILLARIWEEFLGIERVGLDDNFFHLGGHSLLAVGLLSRIERQLGQKFPLTALFQGPTIEDLARILRETSQVQDTSPLIHLRHQGDAPPWYFVHPLDGQVHWYVELARDLGEGIPAFGLQAPGLHDRALVQANVAAIAEAYLSAIREIQPQGPYFLAGWSVGGTIAFEMARAFQVQGQAVGALVLIDALRPMAESKEDDIALWNEVIVELTRGRVDREAWSEALLPLDHNGRLAHVAADLTGRGPLPSGLGTAYLERMLGVYFATLKAVRSYEPEPCEGPGILVRATATVEKHAASPLGPSFGWAPLFKGGLEVYDLPGDHYSILGKDKAGALASILAGLR